MTFQTLGLKNMHKPNHHLSTNLVNKIMRMRKEGLSCKQIADLTGVGRSTVARYTSDWYQKYVISTGVPRRGHLPKKMQGAVQQSASAVPKPAPVEVSPPVKRKRGRPRKHPVTAPVAAATSVKQDVSAALPPEVLAYVNAIYKSQREKVGNPIGNLFIRIGKALGGHYPV